MLADSLFCVIRLIKKFSAGSTLLLQFHQITRITYKLQQQLSQHRNVSNKNTGTGTVLSAVVENLSSLEGKIISGERE